MVIDRPPMFPKGGTGLCSSKRLCLAIVITGSFGLCVLNWFSSKFKLKAGPVEDIDYEVVYWTAKNITASNSNSGTEGKPAKYLHVHPKGRIGNQMFQYAVLFSVAKATGRIPVGGEDFTLGELFSNLCIPFRKFRNSATFNEVQGCTFTPTIFTHLPDATHVLIQHWLQSWKYFERYKDDIRREFVIRKELITSASNYILNVKKTIKTSQNVTFVGIHVRRGDYLKEFTIKFGFKVAPESYILKAVTYFRQKYHNIHFIVAAENTTWIRDTLQNLEVTDVSFPELDGNTDFAILTLCDHLILTVGTFGWWAGWLSKGEVLYYANPARPGTPYYNSMKMDDYYPRSWIKIGD